ncbi:MAG: hypothetical protein IJI92_02735 [Erysipelotrichaceae bacterium]|nr:hypothetical protein [Erysipelotrichaceae bacterium]
MKKLLILVAVLFMIVSMTGCSSSEAAGNGNTTDITIDTPEADEGAFARTLSDSGSEIPAESDRYHPFQDTSSSSDLSFEYFDFFEDLIYSGIPEDAYYPALKYMPGEWKYRIRMIRDNSIDGFIFNEIGYSDLEINYDKETVIVVLHPRLASYNYEVYEETDEEVGYTPFEGGFEGNALKLIDGNQFIIMYLENYYAYEGREYILGTMWMSEEDFCQIVFVRGQD